MELLDPEYIVVEDLIECGTIGLSSMAIMSNHSGLCADLWYTSLVPLILVSVKQ